MKSYWDMDKEFFYKIWLKNPSIKTFHDYVEALSDDKRSKYTSICWAKESSKYPGLYHHIYFYLIKTDKACFGLWVNDWAHLRSPAVRGERKVLSENPVERFHRRHVKVVQKLGFSPHILKMEDDIDMLTILKNNGTRTNRGRNRSNQICPRSYLTR